MSWLEQANLLVEKARHDFVVVAKAATDFDFADDILGIHVQQTAEKCMKAVLCIHGVAYRRTHDLQELHDLLVSAGLLVFLKSLNWWDGRPTP